MVSAPKGQRWLLLLSQERRKREDKRLEKREEKLNKYITELSREGFVCDPDTVAAANKFIKSLKWHQATVNSDWHDANHKLLVHAYICN